MKKVRLSYAEYGELIEELTEKIMRDSFDLIFGLERGGLPVAVHLSHKLNIPLVVKMEEVFELLAKQDTLSVLVVDDIIDTGSTLEGIFYDIDGIKRKTAVLYYKPHASFTPDYYVRQTTDWLVFPWENSDERPNRKMYESLE